MRFAQCCTVRGTRIIRYAYIRAEQFPGRITRLRVLVLYCNVEIRVSGLLPLGIPARGWSCPPLFKGPIELNSRTQTDSDKRAGPRLNDVHVLSRHWRIWAV